ncbi:TFIIB-type zinc finger domain-containing protein [Rhodophyticola sp. CCM32]|uniref:TFIIB-type zinc finger domain-containing protein n=1 Tax=Rhodophyticola sp. CCM32 TaxID=2916397 RepID=UPI001EE58805|nr:TFIIB-type zinc finger domain-containing protein [Rhodophyticola sp. CCM32]
MADAIPDTPIEEHRFPCDNCGADFRFDPDQGKLVCDHCGNERVIEGDGPWAGSAIRELDFQTALRDLLPAQEMEEKRVTSCPNCGAQVEFLPEIHAKECPFCATPVVTDTGQQRQIKPKAVLPFKLDEHAARDAMTRWLGKLWFAPNGLQEYARKGRRLDGMYTPYWTFDADTHSRYRGQRGTVYFETRSDGKGGTRQVQKIRWRRVSGRVARFFDDVLVLASTSLPKRYTDRLAPWDLTALAPYTPEFLAGFRAEGYTVDLEGGMDEARRIMDAQITRDIRADIGGDMQRIDQVETDIADVTFKHVLLPVWLAAYKYRGKSYRFVVNGQSGKVQGERPYSAWKIAFAVLGAVIVIALGVYLYSVYGEGGSGQLLPRGGFGPGTK